MRGPLAAACPVQANKVGNSAARWELVDRCTNNPIKLIRSSVFEPRIERSRRTWWPFARTSEGPSCVEAVF